MVGANTAGLTMLNPPRPRDLITPDEALVLAAYLVSMAEHEAENTFDEVLNAVLGA
jgi:hypothetical protein